MNMYFKIDLLKRMFLGLGRSSELDRWEEIDEQMRPKHFDPIENFSDKIDQLLAALNRARTRKIKPQSIAKLRQEIGFDEER